MNLRIVEWRDFGREPKCPPNPSYPDGKDVEPPIGADRQCSIALPCPAKRCGAYIVECERCGIRAAVTTAGRPDDPRSLTLNCLPPPPAH